MSAQRGRRSVGIAWQALSVIAALSVPVQRVYPGPYASLVVFGDSISDVGNWALDAGYPGGILPSPYDGGRLSNGPLWVEHLATRLGLPAPTPSLAGGTNYAWAGGTTGSIPGEDVNMDVQVQSYLQGRAPAPTDLFVLWGGANDFFGGQADPAAPVRFLGEMIETLAAAGGRSFLVVNLPRYFGSSSLNTRLRRHAVAFNSLLATELETIRSRHSGVQVREFDYFSLFEDVRANPAAFDFQNAFQPACLNCNSASPTVVPNPAAYYFWDDVHPTAAAHRLIGAAAFNALVPEPCGLAVIMSAIAVLSLRRRPALVEAAPGKTVSRTGSRSWSVRQFYRPRSLKPPPTAAPVAAANLRELPSRH